MKRALMTVAVVGAFWTAGAFADQSFPSAADETTPSMTTITSLDTKNGGYKGWGPMANLQGPATVDESNAMAQIEQERHHKQQLAEVNSVREQVWVANAPLRSEYENIGATRSQAGGFGRFFSRDK